MLSPEEVNTNLKNYLNNIPYVFEKNLFNLKLMAINYIDKDNFKLFSLNIKNNDEVIGKLRLKLDFNSSILDEIFNIY
jgi:flagellin-specific chaperone FliS